MLALMVAVLLAAGGKIDPKAIKYVLEKAHKKVQACYEPERAKNKTLEGTVKVKWTIEPTGKTSDVSVTDSSMKNANVEACLVQVVGGLVFPKPKNPMLINYPFSFSPSD